MDRWKTLSAECIPNGPLASRPLQPLGTPGNDWPVILPGLGVRQPYHPAGVGEAKRIILLSRVLW